jgi:hypothetical protein
VFRCGRGVKHQISRTVNDLIVRCDMLVDGIRQHVDDARLSWRSKRADLVPALNLRSYVRLCLAFRTQLFDSESSDQCRGAALRVKACGFPVEWRLSIDETGESVRTFPDFS